MLKHSDLTILAAHVTMSSEHIDFKIFKRPFSTVYVATITFHILTYPGLVAIVDLITQPYCRAICNINQNENNNNNNLYY